jgi:PAS domain S-box-containing protein
MGKGISQTRVKDPAAQHLTVHWSDTPETDRAALIEQLHYLESVVQMSPTAILTTDLQSNVTSWNPAAEELFGYAKEEAIGQNVDELVCKLPALREEGQRYDDEVAAGGMVRAITRRTRKDGSLVDVEIFAAPVYVEDEQVGFVCIYHDITELQREKQYNESLLEVSPAAIVTIDLNDNVASWNPAAEQLFGYTREEALGRNLNDLVANDPTLHSEAVRVNRDVESGDQIHMTTRRTRKDGSLVEVDILAAPISVGSELVGMYAIYHDVSELQRQKRYFEALVLNDPVAVVIVDSDVTVKLWNPAAEKLFGYRKEEALGRNLDELIAFTDEVRAEALSYSGDVVGGKLVHSITKRNRKDGSFVDVEVSAVSVTLAGELLGYYAIYHDVTELQRARREADAATEAKSAFLATMSHEIRTPMNAVIGMTGLLLDTELNSEQRDYAEVIRSSGDALLAIINDILDFSKIEAGKLELEHRPFELRECIEAALELIAMSASEKGVDLAYELDPRAPSGLVGDVTRLRQILINLLNNAIKFTDEGEVVLSVTVDDPDGRLRFSVRDTGIGIAEDRVGDLFESFSQVDASTTRRYGGTGLGLAISKRLSELMGGTMWVESRAGEGSVFSFTIEAEPALAVARAFERGAAPRLEGKRVLVVDDNATNRHILVRQTESWGMRARDTEFPSEALDWILRGDPVDVAILDMHMPEMNGLMLAAEMRRVRDSRALPLVMLTSLGHRERDTGTVDFAAYLTKPIRPSQLFDVLMGVFGDGAGYDESRLESVDTELAKDLPLRILIAEDNSVNQKLAVSMLEKIGYRADVTGNGVEALEALERQPYDVVLMDVQMPEMDGLEATRRIHERWPGTERPYVIAATANAMQEEKQACFVAGMDDYLSKPIRIKELVAALGRTRPQGASEPSSERSLSQTADSNVDAKALEVLRESFDDGLVAELIGTFLEEAPSLVETAKAAVEAPDSETLQRAAHTLKSNAATFGATSLADLCRELEGRGKAAEIEGAEELVAQVGAELATTMRALEARLEELGNE